MIKIINTIKQAKALIRVAQALTEQPKDEKVKDGKPEAEKPKDNKPQQPAKKYTVRPGDTLSFIAQDFYGNTALWPIIAEANNIKTEQEIRSLEIGRVLDIPTERELSPEEKSRRIANPKPAFFNPQDKQKIEEFTKQQKLEDLSKKSSIVLKHSNSKHCDERISKALDSLSSKMGKPIRVTEAFPPTSMHQSRSHYDGRAVDITLPDPRYADQVCQFLRQQGLKALNEYKVDTKYKTGGHIHIEAPLLAMNKQPHDKNQNLV
jgi:LysM repeat protein